MVNGLQVRLFGDVSIQRGGRSLTFPPGKALELFCYLLIHRDRAHAREAVAEMLWPEAEPGAGRKNLRQALWRLNTTMPDRSDEHGAGSALVVIDPGWVRVNPDAPYWLDVNAFEESYAAVRDVPGHTLSDVQANAVERALELYRGDLVTAWYHDWCHPERDRLRHAHLAMLDQMMGYCEARGLYAKGVGLGQALLGHDTARERTHRQLMRLHYAAGDRTAALRQYERCVAVVDREFGVRPSADTTLLYEQIWADRADDIMPKSALTAVAERSPRAPRERAAVDGARGRVGQVHAGAITLPKPRRTAVATHVGAARVVGLRPEDRDEVRGFMDGAGYADSTQHLLAELARLDILLERQVRRARLSHGERDDRLSAYYIPDAEVDALLGRPVDAPPLDDDPEIGSRLDRLSNEIAERVKRGVRDGAFLRLVALVERFDLCPLDLEVVVACLALETDRRYERLYGYLNDDVTRRAPTVDLILTLLCTGLPARTAARTRFTSAAPLVRHRLILLSDDPAQPSHSLLGSNVRLDPRVAGFLLEDDEIADQLRPYARVVAPAGSLDDLHFPVSFGASVARLAERAGDDLMVYCQGGYGLGKQSVAAACCQRWHAPLLVVAADLLADRPIEEFATLVGLVDREARLLGAVMYWENIDALLAEQGRPRLSLLLSMLAAHRAPAFLAGETGWEPADLPGGVTFVRLEFPAPGYDERIRLWEAALGGAAPAVELAEVAGKFRLSGGQIQDAAATARHLAYARSPGAPRVSSADLYAACRAQSNRKLAELAQRIAPHYSWDDIVLPADRMEQLREIANQVRYRALVYESWGFERKLANGRGLAVLFAGPSGTGKTMAADVLAHDLGLDLYRIDLSTVVSKYIGETEKNLSRIFAEAATSNAVLFFDEADALFGKRSAVRDAHDRYANLEISYLLQRMEQHEGVVVLATNLRKNLDDAFIRRLHATIDFPVPGVEDRRRIWRQVWPDGAPLEEGLDLDLLAGHVDLPGGSIRNIALAGAFLAAAEGGVVTMAHLLQATRREYQKMGKLVSIKDFAASAT
ncbi:AAA family ATPase [Plantactinospora sp. WMMB334]|uniref:AAA family ATPase n=1 Tax=Plantactinospora sp. WMMB334 TaxID=3404119 RepID=UPI003B93E6F5